MSDPEPAAVALRRIRTGATVIRLTAEEHDGGPGFGRPQPLGERLAAIRRAALTIVDTCDQQIGATAPQPETNR